jgi:uncharacterized protein YjbI with pentapeptide repeats
MKPTWKKYLLYGSITIGGGVLLVILIETVRAKNTGFETKTLWDWMELLVIPLVLAIGAFYLERSERAVDRKTADDRAKLERELATDRQQEAALQAYLDRMAELLLKEKLSRTKNANVLNVARVRTLTVMRGLNAARNGIVLRLLRDIGLAGKQESNFFADANLEGVDLQGVHFGDTNLEGADLNNANLHRANLQNANLHGAILHRANLQNAYLKNANLYGVILYRANLQNANLHRANLQEAILNEANLQAAVLQDANLQDANLSIANLQNGFLIRANLENASLGRANLQNANLQGAILRGANLQDAKVTNDQLATANSLQGATMPDGTKHD